MIWMKRFFYYLTIIFATGCAIAPPEPYETISMGDKFIDWNLVSEEMVSWGPSRAIVTKQVPPDETQEDWTRMLTTVAVDRQGYETPPTGLEQVAAIQNQYKEVCEKTSFGEPKSNIENGFPATYFYVACDLVTSGPTAGAGDYTFGKIVEATVNLFIVQLSWRGELPDPTLRPISDTEYERWMTILNEDVRVVVF